MIKPQLQCNKYDGLSLILSLALILAVIFFRPTINSAMAKDSGTESKTCPVRSQNENMARAMLALSATNNCENLPYNKKEVEDYIESMKCNEKAKIAIEQTRKQFAAQFDPLFAGPAAEAMCAKAKNFKSLTN